MGWIIIFIVDISVILDNSISLKELTNITSCQQYLFTATRLIKNFFPFMLESFGGKSTKNDKF